MALCQDQPDLHEHLTNIFYIHAKNEKTLYFYTILRLPGAVGTQTLLALPHIHSNTSSTVG